MNSPNTESVRVRSLAYQACALLLASLIGLLGGCSEPGVGSSGTGYSNGSQFGTVNGFGSIIVESNRYDDTNATVALEVDPATPQAANRGDIQLGMQVLVQFDGNDAATTVRIIPQVIGRVDSATASTILVAGQTIVVNTSGNRATVLEGFEQIAALVGERVRVFGQFAVNGMLLATRIEQRGLQDTGNTLVTGVVTGTPTPDRLQMGALETITQGATASVGDIVTVYSSSEPQNGVLTSDGLLVRTAINLIGETVRIGSVIRQLNPDGTIVVGQVTVDPGQSSIITETGSGTRADLTPGRAIRVRGTRLGGNLVADTIELLSVQSDLQQVTGLITDFFSDNSFRVRGVLIDASSATITGGMANNLTDNVAVSVSGPLVNGRLVANSVSLLLGSIETAQTLFGEVGAYDMASGRLTLLGQTAQVSARTQYVDVSGQPLDSSVLANGITAIATGNFNNGVFAVGRLVVLPLGDQIRRLNGSAYAVDTSAQRLRIGRVDIRWDSLTVFVGNPAGLQNGSLIRIEGVADGNRLMATRIEIQPN